MPLHKLGFKMHAELAETLGLASYRRLPALRVTPGRRSAKTIDICPWLDGAEVADSDYMDQLGCAQVRARLVPFCTHFVFKCGRARSFPPFVVGRRSRRASCARR